MAATDPVTEDQTGIKWEDAAWPSVPPFFPFDNQHVLMYFERSPFFDPESNNIKARKEGRDPADPAVLASMGPGVEYIVERVQHPYLFVIKKQLRKDNGVTPMAYYYVIEKAVYQAPTLHAAIHCRMRRCLWNLRAGFARLQADLDPVASKTRQREQKQQQAAQPQPSPQPQDASAPSPEPSGSKPTKLIPVNKVLNKEELEWWSNTDKIIINVLKKYPTHLPTNEVAVAAYTALASTPGGQNPETPQQGGAGPAVTVKAEPQQAGAAGHPPAVKQEEPQAVKRQRTG